jgi:hypothetical protein
MSLGGTAAWAYRQRGTELRAGPKPFPKSSLTPGWASIRNSFHKALFYPKLIPRPTAEPATAESALAMNTTRSCRFSEQDAVRNTEPEPGEMSFGRDPRLDARHPKLIPWAGQPSGSRG